MVREHLPQYEVQYLYAEGERGRGEIPASCVVLRRSFQGDGQGRMVAPVDGVCQRRLRGCQCGIPHQQRGGISGGAYGCESGYPVSEGKCRSLRH